MKQIKKINAGLFILSALLLFGCRAVTLPDLADVPEEEDRVPSGVPGMDVERMNGAWVEEIGNTRWLVYDQTVWRDYFEGFITTIERIAVSDNMHYVDGEPIAAVMIRFRMENTADKPFTSFPDQAALMTSTGERISRPNVWDSDFIGGEIRPGEIKEGSVVWILDSGGAENIEWIQLEWNTYAGALRDFSAERRANNPEIMLE